MEFNQTTLRIIAEGNHVPDQEYIQAMARALLNVVVIVPRPNSDLMKDGSPHWYDVFKGGVKRGQVYAASTIKTFVLEIPGCPEEAFERLADARTMAENYLVDM